MIRRRKFLAAGVCGAAWLGWGCSRPDPPETHERFEIDPVSGNIVGKISVSLPPRRWKVLPPGAAGFVLGDTQGLLLLGWDSAGVVEVKGPTEAIWDRPDQLVAGQRLSAEEYELSLRNPAQARPLWTRKLGLSQLLGSTEQAILLAHPQGISALHRSDGKDLWNRPDLVDVKCHFLGTDTLLVGHGNQGEVFWLDLKTGETRRTVATDKENRVIVVASDGQFSLVFTRRIALFGFGPKADKPLWKRPISSEEHESELLAFSGSTALIRLDNSCVALDLPGGQELWRCSLFSRCCVAQQTVLMLRPADLSTVQLEARDLKSGRVLWNKNSRWATTAALGRDKSLFVLGDNLS
jgi:hypothetical protein